MKRGSALRGLWLMSLLVGTVVVTALVGCGGSNPSVPEVSMASDQFSPRSVTASVGDTIRWVNNDSVAHTVTVDGTNPAPGGPNSDAEMPSGISGGESWNWTVPNAAVGTRWYYHCRFHGAAGNGTGLGPGMSGLITVGSSGGGGY